MNNAKSKFAAELMRAQKNKLIWKRAVMCMAAAVVFVTTYMLILPAITMSNDVTYCGQDHEHNVECYVEPATVSEEEIAAAGDTEETEPVIDEETDPAASTVETEVNGEEQEAVLDTSEELSSGEPQNETEEPAEDDGLSVLEYSDETVRVEVAKTEGGWFAPESELKVTELDMTDENYIEDVMLNAMAPDEELLENRQYSVEVIGDVGTDNEDLEIEFTYQPDVEIEDSAKAVITAVSEDNAEIVAEDEISTGEDVTATFVSSEVQNYGVRLMAARVSDVPEGRYGNYTLKYNNETDAFTADNAYKAYYNENSPLGTAGSFHIVGFGTVNMRTHCNGNVLANTLIANSNFGTNGYPNELSYIQNYEQINGVSASATNHILVLGSNNTITLRGNRDELHVNDRKIDKPYNMVIDTDTEANPFIDMERVEAEIRGISKRLSGNKTAGLTISFSDENNRSITLNDSGGVGYYTTTAAELKRIPAFHERKLKLKGFSESKSGTIVINVDCTGVDSLTLPEATVFIGDQEQSTNETTVFTSGKVIWNFTNAEGVVINTKRMTGMVVAPGAEVHITQNLNGTVVAEDIYIEAESHRTDFTGDVENIKGIKVRKVDSENISIYLDGAKFDLYKWNASSGKYELAQTAMSSEEGKPIVISQVTYNQAYRLIETKAPAGYELKTEPYDFIISNKNTVSYPVIKPNDGSELVELNADSTIYFKNEETTELTIKKEWLDSEGNLMLSEDLEETEIKVDIWKNVYTDPDRTSLAYSAVCRTGIVISGDNGWQITISDLPANGTEQIDGSDTEVYYKYFVKEQENDKYNVSYNDNGGMVSGTITVTNQERVQYVIPETGGPGTYWYAAAGLMIIVAGILQILYRFRRREAEN